MFGVHATSSELCRRVAPSVMIHRSEKSANRRVKMTAATLGAKQPAARVGIRHGIRALLAVFVES
jgi:hypothetical protein